MQVHKYRYSRKAVLQTHTSAEVEERIALRKCLKLYIVRKMSGMRGEDNGGVKGNTDKRNGSRLFTSILQVVYSRPLKCASPSSIIEELVAPRS